MALLDKISVSQHRLALLERIEYRLAETAADREAIYRLRYRAYLKEGAIPANSQRLVTDRYDEAPNTWIFGVHFDGQLVSSVRISVGSRQYPLIPSTDVFSDLIEPWIGEGKVLVDPTRFVADPLREPNLPDLPYMTLRLAYVACAHFNADIGLASVRQEHQAFYRRVFMHRPVSGPRAYPGLLKPICLMAVNFPAMRDQVARRYPFLRSTQIERHRLFEPLEAASGSVVPLPRAHAMPVLQKDAVRD